MNRTDIAIIKGLQKQKNDKCTWIEDTPEGKVYHFENTDSVLVPRGGQGS